MNTTEQNERQEFLDEISQYQYIREDGRLVLEKFCVYLSHCFAFDSILDKSPQPRDVYNLLIQLISDEFGVEGVARYVQHQKIADWRPELVYIYPEMHMTCIHITALIKVSHDWIYYIGQSLMGIPDSDEDSKYFAWVKEDWVAVYAFINNYHNTLFQFQKDIDHKHMKANGYSAFEALNLAMSKNMDFDEAVDLLKDRHRSYKAALGQIKKAVKDKYYLEAIVLEECLISNCIFNYLEGNNIRLTSQTFHALLDKIMTINVSLPAQQSTLFEDIDKWRKGRNTAIHGFITSQSNELKKARVSFPILTESIAKQGEGYCKSIIDWYELECVNFIKHEFPSERKSSLH